MTTHRWKVSLSRCCNGIQMDCRYCPTWSRWLHLPQQCSWNMISHHWWGRHCSQVAVRSTKWACDCSHNTLKPARTPNPIHNPCVKAIEGYKLQLVTVLLLGDFRARFLIWHKAGQCYCGWRWTVHLHPYTYRFRASSTWIWCYYWGVAEGPQFIATGGCQEMRTTRSLHTVYNKVIKSN